jgi:outer membrane lipopolysaccharide assembly protein LptE/RlpB
MSLLSPMTPGLRRARAASAALAAALLLAGCMYRFTGGGLPSHIRTVYVELWENNTPYEFLRADVQRQLQQELPRNLGLRLAPQTTADAVVRGRLNSYEEVVVNIDPNTTPGGRINTQQSRVQITFDAEIYDVKNDAVLWRGSSISAIGNYNPQGESVEAGRERALEELIEKLIQGAQSQW